MKNFSGVGDNEISQEIYFDRLMTNQHTVNGSVLGNTHSRSGKGRESHHRGQSSRIGGDRSRSQDIVDEGKVVDHVMPRFFRTVNENMAWRWLFKEYFEDEENMVGMYNENQLNTVVCGLMKMIIDYNSYFRGMHVVTYQRVETVENTYHTQHVEDKPR